MARDFSSNVRTRLGSGSLVGTFLIEMSLRGDTVATRRFTTAPSDLTFNSNTYTSSVDVAFVTAPDATTIVDDQTYSIEFLDSSNVLKGLLDSNNSVNGSPITIRVVLGDANGAPMLSTSDVFVGYSGRINGVTRRYLQREERAYLIQLGSPFADFEAVQPRIASADFQNNISTTDTCFDEVHTGDEDVVLKWGKA